MPDALETRLADLGRSIDWPDGAGIAERVGDRLREDDEARSGGRWAGMFGARRLRRSLLLAVAALVILAAAVAAAGILLPGLRIVFVPPGATLAPPGSPPGTGGPLGSSLGLGTVARLGQVEEAVGFEPLLPADLDAPDAAFVARDRVTLVWRSGAGLPETEAPGVGLLLTEIRGRVDPGYYEKQLHAGPTTVESVDVGAQRGYWLTGEPHGLVYRRRDGTFAEETRRIVGDVLIWQQGDLTLRLESGLGRDATIGLAESLGVAP